jgi:predicted exporter
LRLYQENFANARELVVSLHAPEADLVESAAQRLSTALRQESNLVARVSWVPPWLERPEHAGELVGYLWLNQPPEIFGELTNRLAPSRLATTLREAQEQMATELSPEKIAQRGYDPCALLELPESSRDEAPAFGGGEEFFVSSDGRFRILFVQPRPDTTSYRQCRVWLRKFNQVLAGLRQRGDVPANVRVRLTGRPVFVTEIAAGMETDVTSSVGATVLVVMAAFWLVHRRWKPLGWLLALLGVTLVMTLALGGLVLHTLNVISVGFAAILLGLSVDYGLVLYQEATACPGASIGSIRRAVGPSIRWAAITSAGAFAMLNFSGLPGLAQLGSLVAIGLGIGALVMYFAYLPPLLRSRRVSETGVGHRPFAGTSTGPADTRTTPVLLVTTIVAAVAVFSLSSGQPRLDSSADALRPEHSEAYAALAEIKRQLSPGREPCWVVLRGEDPAEMAQRLTAVERILDRAVSNRVIERFNLPRALWPQPDCQRRNLPTAAALAANHGTVKATILDAGFTSNSLPLTEAIVGAWKAASASGDLFWPTNDTSRWVFDRFLSRAGADWLVAGLVVPRAEAAKVMGLNAELPPDTWLTGWEMLGASVLTQVRIDFWRVVGPMVGLLIASLALAFRRPVEVVLSLVSLLFSLACLLAFMRWAGWSWNLMNLMAIPLVLGVGVDFSIHMQLALRRHHGNLALARRTVGRALFLCGTTTLTGFGSNAWASNAGMASLGRVCAVGVLCVMLTGIFLLPHWWVATVGRTRRPI